MSSNQESSWQQQESQSSSNLHHQQAEGNNEVSNNFQLALLPFFEQLTNMYFPQFSSNIQHLAEESNSPNETCTIQQVSETLPTLNNSSSSSSEKKRKHKVACIYCNKLHKKCDGEAPNSCSRCKSKGISCVYLPPQKRGPKKKKSSSNSDVEESIHATIHSTNENQSNSTGQLIENHSQLFQITSLYSSPLSGLQFNITTQTRTLMNLFLDCVTCHSLVDGPMLDQCLNSSTKIPNNSSPDPNGFTFLINIVCAMGAQRLEDRKNCVEFFNRARSQASYLFDSPSRETSCALSLMGVYACSEGERVKSHMYNRIAVEMASSVCSYQVENDKFYQALSALSFANSFSRFMEELKIGKLDENEIIDQKIVEETRNYLKSSKCTRKIEQLEKKISEMSLIKGSEEISITATLIYYLISSRVVSNNQTDLIELLRKLEIMEKYIESDKFQKHDIQKNVHRFCLYSLKSDVLHKCGLEKMALHCSMMASGLASKASFWKSAPVVIVFIPILIKVNWKVNDSSMIIENFKALKLISSKFVVLKNTLHELTQLMRKRRDLNDFLTIFDSSTKNSSVIGTYQEETSAIPLQFQSVEHSSNSNESFLNNNDISEFLQQLGTVNYYDDKLDSIWQAINQ